MSTGPHSLFPRLLADVGGTNARFALETAPGVIEEVDVRASAQFPTLLAAARDYLRQTGAKQVAHAAIGIATAVTGDSVRMTNHSWAFSIAALKRDLGLASLVVLNDFTALAWSLPHLPSTELIQVGGGAPVSSYPMALIGPGTGLGVSGLVYGAQGPIPLSGEGGHVGFAPEDEEEVELWRFARTRFEHVSTERFLSGSGLGLIHEARLAMRGLPDAGLSAADITRQALGGQSPECMASLDRFCAILGSAAGALALTLGARGGVFIGGGIVPRLGETFVRSPFRRRFEQAGRLSGFLAAMPTYVIHSQYPGLIGAQAALAAHLREPHHA
ncbi:glucokinase [Paludibacterium purpuratum]|uniref:Glucokinase n=1 Tax=Paludibacterium purpuratum TaxID=1144873 RepID=A0A4R7B3B8_9NEIS|nr:glucokinase [Paludibacterium purpuratum]TDR76520.1 glucokinase [Paludibacterium purpuratum]